MGNKNGDLLMAPEWLMYPNIPYGSIGWRMGYGEGYAMDFYRWFNKLEEDEKKKYREMFPEPKRWGREDKILVEASPYDSVWGVQMSEDDADIKNPELWRGENLLGFVLMEVRNEIIRICKNSSMIDFISLHKIYDFNLI